MKFINYDLNGEPSVAVVDGDDAVDLRHVHANLTGDIGAALEKGIDLLALGREALASNAPRVLIQSLNILPPIVRPGKIICLGLNYFDHAKEGG